MLAENTLSRCSPGGQTEGEGVHLVKLVQDFKDKLMVGINHADVNHTIKPKTLSKSFRWCSKYSMFYFHYHLNWETRQAPTARHATLTSDVSQHVVWTLHSEKVSQKVGGGLKGHGLY